MEKEKKKIGFWGRVNIAVAKLENYSVFLEEKTSLAVKYFFQIVFLMVVVIGILQTYNMMKQINKGYQYIQNELPDFSYENGKLTFPERVFAHDEEYDIYLIADTTEELTLETLQDYKKQIKTTGVILLKDKLIYKTASSENEYTYQMIMPQYGISALTKARMLQEIENIGLPGIAVTLFFVLSISLYMVQLVATLMDWLILTIFALITARVCRIPMTGRHCFTISIYALTLSIFWSMFYNIAYTTFGFYTEYFRLVYLLISYVYVVAVILMLKSDLLRQQAEVGKIVEVQKEIHEEQNPPEDKPEKKEKPEDDKTPQDDENTTNNEPDGSEI